MEQELEHQRGGLIFFRPHSRYRLQAWFHRGVVVRFDRAIFRS